MPRTSPYSILQDDFMLGLSEEGLKFTKLEPRQQLLYLRLWCWCHKQHAAVFTASSLPVNTLLTTSSLLVKTLLRCCELGLIKKLSPDIYNMQGLRKLHSKWVLDEHIIGELNKTHSVPKQEQEQEQNTTTTPHHAMVEGISSKRLPETSPVERATGSQPPKQVGRSFKVGKSKKTSNHDTTNQLWSVWKEKLLKYRKFDLPTIHPTKDHRRFLQKIFDTCGDMEYSSRVLGRACAKWEELRHFFQARDFDFPDLGVISRLADQLIAIERGKAQVPDGLTPQQKSEGEARLKEAIAACERGQEDFDRVQERTNGDDVKQATA